MLIELGSGSIAGGMAYDAQAARAGCWPERVEGDAHRPRTSRSIPPPPPPAATLARWAGGRTQPHVLAWLIAFQQMCWKHMVTVEFLFLC